MSFAVAWCAGRNFTICAAARANRPELRSFATIDRPPRHARADPSDFGKTSFRTAGLLEGSAGRSHIQEGLIHGLPRSCGRSDRQCRARNAERSEEHTSELQSLIRISYAGF